MNNKDTVEAPARSYKDHLREQITNAEEATGYLSACYAEGPETFALAVKDVWEFARVGPPAAPDEADKALAQQDDRLVQTILRPIRGCATDSQYSDAFDRAVAALAQARKEGAQPVHPDDLADTINKFLFEQYACTIDHPQMHVLKELVRWWPDPASKQER